MQSPPTLPAGRRAVLYALRRADRATVDELAEALEITVSGTRQHLDALVASGLVVASDAPRDAGRRGRPQLSYQVTELADALFPKAYDALANELLDYMTDDYLTDKAGSAVDRLFARRRERRIELGRERIARRKTLGAKVAELAKILDEDGYFASSKRIASNVYEITEHNCAIAAVAKRYGQACTSEIEFIRALLPDAQVERTRHMIAGDSYCGYRITAR